MSFEEESNAWKLVKDDRATSSRLSLDRGMREPTRNSAATACDVSARSELHDRDQVMLRHLNMYFSCSTCASAMHRLVQDLRGTFRHDNPFAQDQRPNQIQAFNYYRSAMKPTIEDFLARGRVSAEALLESCGRLREGEQGETSEALVYVLASEHFESFMGMMRRMDSPVSSTRLTTGLSSGLGGFNTEGRGVGKERGEEDEEDEDEQGREDESSEAWLTGALAGTFDNNMELSSTFDTTDMGSSLRTDMALAATPPRTLDGQHGSSSFLGCTHPRRDEPREDLRFLAMQFYQSIHDYSFSNTGTNNNDGNGSDKNHGGHHGGGWRNDDADEKSNAGSEEEFPESDPSDPTDGGLPCLARRCSRRVDMHT